MALSSYNGFSGAQRERSQRWLNQQFAAGLPRPCRCQACGQDRGAIDYHTEDYSEPFGPHIYAHQLCYRCHLMLHCRRRAPDEWALYRYLLAQGCQFPPISRSWSAFQAWLAAPEKWAGQVLQVAEPRERTYLDDLADGLHRPRT